MPPRRKPRPPGHVAKPVRAAQPPGRKATRTARVKTQPRLGRRIAVNVLLIGLVIITATLGAAIWVETALRRVAVFSTYDSRPVAGVGTNWLLVGSDSREDLTEQQQAELATGGDVGNGRTDTILLVHIPGLMSGEPTTMVSIPRDSYVDIPGYGSDKINTAFAVGGAALLAQTVEESTGVRLDHYAEVGFAGFGVVVDALGGVEVCPPEPVNDPLAGIDLPAGCQTLNGPNALGYVRTRATPRADLDRMIHQREFMSALLERAASPAVWLNPWRWYAVPHAILSALTVDTGAHVWSLARLAWALRGSTTTVTVPVGEFTSNEAGSVAIWDSAAANSLFDALRTDTPIPQQVLDSQP